MGGSLVVLASFNYVLTPMLSDLDLDPDQASIALAIPWIASLLVVFVAGNLGDQLGHRTVITWMSVAFITGSAIVGLAQGLVAIVIGLLIEGIASTAIQIVAFGLLSNQFPDPKARAAAFGTFGMVSPFIWMCMPVLTGWVVGEVSWRWVAATWVASGLAVLVAARRLLPVPRSVSALGEVTTPILAGIVVAMTVATLDLVSDDGLVAPTTVISAVGTVAVAAWLVYLLKRLPAPTFTLAPLRVGRSRALLLIVVIIPLINTVFLMTMAFEYLYGLTVLQTALAMVPAQLAAVLGTRLIAGPLMRRFGVTKTSTIFFAILAGVMLMAFFLTPESPLWVPIAYVAAYNVLTVAASITVTSGVLVSVPGQESGLLSAYRGSAQAVGQVLAVVLMNSIVFGLSRLFMYDDFQANGLSSADAVSTMDQIQSESTSPDVMTQYALPLPSGVETSDVMADAISVGLHVNGVIGSALSIACILLVRAGQRKARSAPSAASA